MQAIRCPHCGQASIDAEFCDACNREIAVERLPTQTLPSRIELADGRVIDCPFLATGWPELNHAEPFDVSWQKVQRGRLHAIAPVDWPVLRGLAEERRDVVLPALPPIQIRELEGGAVILAEWWDAGERLPQLTPMDSAPSDTRSDSEIAAAITASVKAIQQRCHVYGNLMNQLHSSGYTWLNFDPDAVEIQGAAARITNLDQALYRSGQCPDRLRISPRYSPPEVCRFQGHKIGPASDVFQLAMFAYYAFAKLLPQGFAGQGLEAFQFQIPPLRIFQPALPTGIWPVLELGLRSDSGQRPASVEQFLHLLDRAVERATLSTPSTRPVSLRQKLPLEASLNSETPPDETAHDQPPLSRLDPSQINWEGTREAIADVIDDESDVPVDQAAGSGSSDAVDGPEVAVGVADRPRSEVESLDVAFSEALIRDPEVTDQTVRSCEIGWHTITGTAKSAIGGVNQDAIGVQTFTLNDRAIQVIIVADGVSISRIGRGELASQTACAAILEVIREVIGSTNELPDWTAVLERACFHASEKILEQAQEELDRQVPVVGAVSDCHKPVADHEIMSTTAVIGIWDGSVLTLANVGDSRAYLISKGIAEQLTVDGDVGSSMLQAGTPPEQVQELGVAAKSLRYCLGACTIQDNGDLAGLLVSHPLRNRPLCTQWRLNPDDTIVLCTDGLVDEGIFLEPADLVPVVEMGHDLTAQEIAERLVELADQKQRPPSSREPGGYGDNIACAVLRLQRTVK